MRKEHAVDRIDRLMVAELERDGRLTVAELAHRVQLTAAPCSRRLRDLERDGVIQGYRAQVNPSAIGLGFEAVVHVTMTKEDARTVTSFENALREIAEIRHAERLFGDPDYLLRVFATNIDDYAHIRDHRIATLPGVERITSTIVMRRIIDDRPFPIDRRT